MRFVNALTHHKATPLHDTNDQSGTQSPVYSEASASYPPMALPVQHAALQQQLQQLQAQQAARGPMLGINGINSGVFTPTKSIPGPTSDASTSHLLLVAKDAAVVVGFQQALAQAPIAASLHVATPNDVWAKVDQLRLLTAGSPNAPAPTLVFFQPEALTADMSVLPQLRLVCPHSGVVLLQSNEQMARVLQVDEHLAGPTPTAPLRKEELSLLVLRYRTKGRTNSGGSTASVATAATGSSLASSGLQPGSGASAAASPLSPKSSAVQQQAAQIAALQAQMAALQAAAKSRGPSLDAGPGAPAATAARAAPSREIEPAPPTPSSPSPFTEAQRQQVSQLAALQAQMAALQAGLGGGSSAGASAGSTPTHRPPPLQLPGGAQPGSARALPNGTGSANVADLMAQVEALKRQAATKSPPRKPAPAPAAGAAGAAAQVAALQAQMAELSARAAGAAASPRPASPSRLGPGAPAAAAPSPLRRPGAAIGMESYGSMVRPVAANGALAAPPSPTTAARLQQQQLQLQILQLQQQQLLLQQQTGGKAGSGGRPSLDSTLASPRAALPPLNTMGGSLAAAGPASPTGSDSPLAASPRASSDSGSRSNSFVAAGGAGRYRPRSRSPSPLGNGAVCGTVSDSGPTSRFAAERAAADYRWEGGEDGFPEGRSASGASLGGAAPPLVSARSGDAAIAEACSALVGDDGALLEAGAAVAAAATAGLAAAAAAGRVEDGAASDGSALEASLALEDSGAGGRGSSSGTALRVSGSGAPASIDLEPQPRGASPGPSGPPSPRVSQRGTAVASHVLPDEPGGLAEEGAAPRVSGTGAADEPASRAVSAAEPPPAAPPRKGAFSVWTSSAVDSGTQVGDSLALQQRSRAPTPPRGPSGDGASAAVAGAGAEELAVALGSALAAAVDEAGSDLSASFALDGPSPAPRVSNPGGAAASSSSLEFQPSPGRGGTASPQRVSGSGGVASPQRVSGSGSAPGQPLLADEDSVLLHSPTGSHPGTPPDIGYAWEDARELGLTFGRGGGPRGESGSGLPPRPPTPPARRSARILLGSHPIVITRDDFMAQPQR